MTLLPTRVIGSDHPTHSSSDAVKHLTDLAKQTVLTIAVVIMGVCGIAPVRAQVSGDANGDGRLTGADLPSLVACLGSPLDGSTPSCESLRSFIEPFPSVTMVSLLDFQVQQQNNTGCTQSLVMDPVLGITGVHHYAGYRHNAAPGIGIFGVKATITPGIFPVLCDEGTSTEVAFSDAWANLIGAFTNGDPANVATHWAQLGFTKDRSNRGQFNTTTTIDYFLEINDPVSIPSRTVVYLSSQAPLIPFQFHANYIYSVEVVRFSSPRQILFKIDDFPFGQVAAIAIARLGWNNITPAAISCMVETVNKEDYVWGRSARKTHFVDIERRTLGGAWVPVGNVNDAALRADLPTMGTFTDDPTGFFVWDRRN